jgi:magnesium chelatase family protein
MAFARVYGAQQHLLQAHLVSVEIDLSRGLHAFSIVGLPSKAVEESRDRVSAAIKNSGFKSPKQTNAKVTVSLAPADLRKEGPAFDLPIALGYLLASDNVIFDPEGRLFAGELSLNGNIQPITGTISLARTAFEQGIRELYVPAENAREAALIEGLRVFGVSNLGQAIQHLTGERRIAETPTTTLEPSRRTDTLSLDDIAGHEAAKRGLVIAAAGGHNIALFGPPGTGKTMLARALQGILPPLTATESLEVTAIYSATGHLRGDAISFPPLRSPHHSASHVSLVGGGSPPKPGEATLAHHGILFMDEFPEFDRESLEALRQPLEERIVSISRAHKSVDFPARFILVAALNPCPCGNHGGAGKTCVCTAKDLSRYRNKISGPIIDRIDMWIEISNVDHALLATKASSGAETASARLAVERARETQRKRFGGGNFETASLNSDMIVRNSLEELALSKEGEAILLKAALSHGLSGRGYHRVIKLARTIADLDMKKAIEAHHVLEALQYRKRN